MANITAADVAKLRKMTGAGMMDCKNALTEAEGNLDKAVELIRERGKAIANKRAGREAGEGVGLAKVTPDGKRGAIVVLNCETDFVAKNQDFIDIATKILDFALANKPADLETLKAQKIDDKNTVNELVMEFSGITGEKMELSHYSFVEAECVVPYIHPGNKLASIVGFSKGIEAQAGKDVAMQVAAMNPVSISEADCPAEVVEQERNIAIQKTRDEQVQKAIEAAIKKAGINPAHVDSEDHIESNQAKGWITAEEAAKAREIIKTVGAEKAASLDEKMIQNIANGRVQKFYKESTLMNQEFIKEGKMTIKQYLQSVDKDIQVVGFKRVSLSV